MQKICHSVPQGWAKWPTEFGKNLPRKPVVPSNKPMQHITLLYACHAQYSFRIYRYVTVQFKYFLKRKSSSCWHK